MDELAAHGPALLRDRRRRRLGIALFIAACAVGGLLSATVPDPAANLDLVLLYYLAFVAAAAVLIFLSIAARE